jgi:hypothetical protein
MDMVFELGLFERARCGERDRRSLAGLVAQLCSLSEKARSEGLLALEEDAQDGKLDRFLALGLRLVLDGVSSEALDEVLVTSIYASGGKGRELLARMIAYTGVRGIAAGHSPELLRVMLEAYLGFETATRPRASEGAGEALVAEPEASR